MGLSALELERYRKQVMLPEIGEKGQQKLKDASILVVGVGGLGSAILPYLVGAGIGRICILDDDHVSLSNLQRQILYTTAELRQAKANLVANKMQALNPEIILSAQVERLTSKNAKAFITGQSLVMDCTDNLDARFLINETCVAEGIPFVYGAVYRYEGQVSVFDAKRGPCFRCLYPQLPPPEAIPDPELNGLLGTLPGVVGLLQATEAIKLLTGIGEPLIGKLILYDALVVGFRTIRLEKNPDCPVCGRRS
jgi:sulfur-carrier protein adenylyltransferase/sulfurtransferase